MVRNFSGAKKQSAEPLEIRRDLLREIADQVQPKGGGEYVFPFTRVDIEVFAQDSGRANALRAILEDRSFPADIGDELQSAGCTGAMPELGVRITEDPAVAEQIPPYKIDYSRRGSTPSEPPKPRPPARLIVLKGQAVVPSLDIDRDLIYIGRTREVVARTGVERYNQLAFDDSEVKVSRKHAFVRYEKAAGYFRAFNDPESQAGTTIVREGRALTCDSTRGIQLRSGDEISLGSALIRFELL